MADKNKGSYVKRHEYVAYVVSTCSVTLRCADKDEAVERARRKVEHALKQLDGMVFIPRIVVLDKEEDEKQKANIEAGEAPFLHLGDEELKDPQPDVKTDPFANGPDVDAGDYE